MVFCAVARHVEVCTCAFYTIYYLQLDDYKHGDDATLWGYSLCVLFSLWSSFGVLRIWCIILQRKFCIQWRPPLGHFYFLGIKRLPRPLCNACDKLNTVNCRKSNQQRHYNRVYFLKMYLFIHRTDMFRLFLSHHQGARYMAQCKRTMRIFSRCGCLQ
jgi:hypothetical protein